MIANVRARYNNGVLVPLEPLDLEEGKDVVVSIKNAPPSGNGSESMLDMFERLRKSVPPDTWDNLPADLSRNKKYYLYGFPKEVD
ncbi:MAG: antitoxin family protein [Caldilineaceae bacterium]|nr:antitoxin family protein [Caldilineaceae bacterium]